MNPSKATLRADRNDANEMQTHEQMRRDGLKPAQRVAICTDAIDVQPLGALDWNRRSDTLSATPDEE